MFFFLLRGMQYSSNNSDSDELMYINKIIDQKNILYVTLEKNGFDHLKVVIYFFMIILPKP